MRISTVFVTVFAIVVVIKAVPAPQGTKTFNETDTRLGGMPPPMMTCYGDNGETYINDIPHTTDCKYFGKCTFYNSHTVIPLTVSCPGVLQFSIKTCTCEYPEVAECFDPGNYEHQAARFSCACAVRLTAGGGYETIGPADKCFNNIE